MAFASLCRSALNDLDDIVTQCQFLVDDDPRAWKGDCLLHLEVASQWSTEFEVWLLDQGLPANFMHLSGPCREVKRVCAATLHVPQLPCWSLEIGQFFCLSCQSVICI